MRALTDGTEHLRTNLRGMQHYIKILQSFKLKV